MNNYIPLATRTLVMDEPHYEMVCLRHFWGEVDKFVKQTEALDGFKKALFYGKPQLSGQLDSTQQVVNRYQEGKFLKPVLAHGIIGIATEAGELLERLQAMQNGPFNMVDRVNLVEEMGDVMWYLAVMANELGVTFEQIQRANIAKLQQRYPSQFDSVMAVNRTIEEELGAIEKEIQK